MFRTHISNRYLNEHKIITAKSQWELEQKVKNQKQKWKEKEKKTKEQKEIENMKKRAIANTQNALEVINEYRNLLKTALQHTHTFDLDKLYNNDTFHAEEPKLDKFIELVNVPMEDKLLEFFFSSIKTKRLEKQKEAERLYYNAFTEYHNNKNEFLNNQKEINNH